MKTACRLMLTKACLLAAAPLAQAGDPVYSEESAPRQEQVENDDIEGWVTGASSARLAPRPARAAMRAADGGRSLELRASEIHVGYHGSAGSVGYNAMLRYDSVPESRAIANPAMVDRGAFSAGIAWRGLYARYDYTFTHDYLGMLDARGSHYLDIGARHAVDDSTWLHLDAGDGRIAGAGNAPWDWRDLRAGFTRKLDDGWTMALNYRRVFGNASLAERYSGAPHFEGLIPNLGRGHRGLVLTINRGF
jgi:hypothetical protein